MKTWKVTYFETITHELIIKAKDENEANKVAEAIYYDDERLNRLVKRNKRPLENEYGYIEEFKDKIK